MNIYHPSKLKFKTPFSRKQWGVKLDKLLSQVVKARDKRCLKCGNPNEKELQACHIYSKGRHTKMRWDLDNVIGMDWKCHFGFAHKEPLLFAELLKEKLPPERLKRLKLRSQITDRSPVDYAAIKLYLEAELAKYNMI